MGTSLTHQEAQRAIQKLELIFTKAGTECTLFLMRNDLIVVEVSELESADAKRAKELMLGIGLHPESFYITEDFEYEQKEVANKIEIY